MAYIKGPDKGQSSFLPPTIDDYVAKDSMVRVIEAFVDGLDMDALGFGRACPKGTGRPGYDPKDLLKLYIYGYTNRIRSSRLIARECTRNVEAMFLVGTLRPDFRTIADFRKDNAKALRGVFSTFVRVCAKLRLFDGATYAVDGTKIRAQNARANAFNKECLDKKLANIEERIERYLEMLDESDDDDDKGDGDAVGPDAVLAAIETLKRRKGVYEGYKKMLIDKGITQILTTDPDAHRMHTKDGFNCCYNAQVATDTSTHLIAGFDITSNPSDAGNLRRVGDNVREETGQKSIEVIADKGYDGSKDILSCLLGGIVPHVALKYDRDARVINLDFRHTPVTDRLRRSTDPKDIAACLYAGVLPFCYEGKGIKATIQYPDTLSCFTKEKDGTVICPQNKVLRLRRRREGKASSEVYSSKKACRSCKNRCTDSTNAKDVAFCPSSDCVPVIVYGSPESPPRQIPEDARISPNNHVLDKKGGAAKKVLIRIEEDKERLKLRMCTAEHPFGTIKWYNGAHYFLTRGKEKVTAELSLSFLSYNLKRVLNMVGFDSLMAALG
jgi:transposase